MEALINFLTEFLKKETSSLQGLINFVCGVAFVILIVMGFAKSDSTLGTAILKLEPHIAVGFSVFFWLMSILFIGVYFYYCYKGLLIYEDLTKNKSNNQNI